MSIHLFEAITVDKSTNSNEVSIFPSDTATGILKRIIVGTEIQVASSGEKTKIKEIKLDSIVLEDRVLSAKRTELLRGEILIIRG